jgi:hypothetical protein
MNTSRPELDSEQALDGIKKISEEISALSNPVEIVKGQRQLDMLVDHFWKVTENN